MILAASAFIGIHDRARPPGPDDVVRLGRALEGAGPAQSWSSGPFAVAWAGSPMTRDQPPPAGQSLIVLRGELYDTVGRVAGVSPDEALAAVCGDAGQEILRDLRGDFAVVAYDERSGRGLLARDHLGGRGLYWHRQGGRFRFATEIVYLLRLLPTHPEPDPAALGHWLSYSFPPERTLYRDVHRLEAAMSLRFGEAPERPRRYWAPVFRRPVSTDLRQIAAGLRTVLSTSVRRRCTDGNTTAVLLSGGLDSSSVAALAARQDGPARLRRAYSAVFPNHPSVDESALIDDLCRALELRSTRVAVRSGSITAGAVEYIRRWSLPPPSPNLFFWFPLLRRAAADGVDSLIDGEAGDELFGLSPYLIADRMGRGRVRAAAALVREIPGGGPHLSRATIRRYLREFGVKGVVPASLERAVRRVRGAARYTPSWLRPELADAYMATDESGAWKRIDGPRWWAYLVGTVTRSMAAEMTYEHVRLRAAQYGLEVRHPLVDVDVIGNVLGMPPHLTYDPRFSRPLLREAMAGLMPDSVRLRAGKSTFDAVFHDALAGPDLSVAKALLDPKTASIGRYVDLEEVRRLYLQQVPPPGDRLWWAMWLWRLVTTECWLRAQERGGLEGEPALTMVLTDLAILDDPAGQAPGC